MFSDQSVPGTDPGPDFPRTAKVDRSKGSIIFKTRRGLEESVEEKTENITRELGLYTKFKRQLQLLQLKKYLNKEIK